MGQTLTIDNLMSDKESFNHPQRMGKKWDDDEIKKLLTSIRTKRTIAEIAIDHQRSISAINSQRRKLAADYWFNDGRPIEEIILFTGLTKEQIEDTIKRRTKGAKTEKTESEELDESSDICLTCVGEFASFSFNNNDFIDFSFKLKEIRKIEMKVADKIVKLNITLGYGEIVVIESKSISLLNEIHKRLLNQYTFLTDE